MPRLPGIFQKYGMFPELSETLPHHHIQQHVSSHEPMPALLEMGG
jgi:hypothetical protein